MVGRLSVRAALRPRSTIFNCGSHPDAALDPKRKMRAIWDGDDQCRPSMRALRFLPGRLPYLRGVGAGDGYAERADRFDETSA